MTTVTNRASAEGLSALPVDNEFDFTYEDFQQIAEMLYCDAGISLPESKAALVYSRLAKRLRALGLGNFRDYCNLVAGQKGIDERKRMLAALTTNVTRFFREPHHFDHLHAKVLPPLLESARRGGRVRLWSAGCSTGQEPYSIALTVLSLLPNAADFDVRILATDIDPTVIAEGKRGVYAQQVVSDIPEEMLRRWFVPDRNGCRVGGELANLVAFRELNLIANWPMKGPFQAIFCRNVVIYFDEDTQTRTWTRLAGMLSPGGYLYIGHSERLGGVIGAFESDGLTTYRLGGAERR
jgi:chemotaxis protein methyltransferase CheR